MNFEELNSKWLWNEKGSDEINQYVCFRKEFSVRETSFNLHICADTSYSVWVNEKLVDFGGYLAYPDNKYYDTYDVSKYLVSGKNVMCILVYYQGISTSCYSKGTPGLIYALTSSNAVISNENTLVCCGSGFVPGPMPLVTGQLGPSFEYDATKELDWLNSDYKNVDFKPAEQLEFDTFLPSTLKKRPIDYLDKSFVNKGKLLTQGNFMYSNQSLTTAQKMQYAFMGFNERNNIISDNKIISKDENVYLIYDLEVQTSGYIEFSFNSDSEAELDISYGQHLDDMRVRSSVGGRNFAFKYIAKKGENKFLGFFRRIACRYLQINISKIKGSFTVNYFGIRTAVYPLPPSAPLKTNDILFKEIDNVCIRTLIQCMHEHYEDTPWREQALYSMDSRVQALCGYYIFGNYEFAKASIDLLMSSMREDGFMDICAPSGIPITIPSFTSIWIVWACEYVFYSNDLAAGELYLSQSSKMIDKHMTMFENGLLKNPPGKKYWHYYDWRPHLDGSFYHEFDVVHNLFFYYGMLNAIKLSNLLNKSYGGIWKEFLEDYKKKINEEFFNAQSKRYSMYLKNENNTVECELAQVLALCCEIVPFADELRADVASNNDMIPLTLNTTIFKYDALLQDESYKYYAMEEIKLKWGKMLKRGATAFYETEDAGDAFDRAGSLCHGWSAVPSYVFRKYFGM